MLREMQREFARAVFDDHPALVERVRDGHFPAAQHVQIYRNNVNETLTAALAAVFPVVAKLVGQGFFGYAAHEYLREHRPLNANLHDFGGAFADFLASFAPAATLPYLPDVARLEWAWHRALHAADAGRLDAQAFATVPAERGEDVRLVLHPSAHVLQSNFPIVRIFEVHQSADVPECGVDFSAGGEAALVIRHGWEVVVEPLAAGAAAWLSSLMRNDTLAQALDAALDAEPEFDLSATLAGHLQRGTFVRIRLS